MLWSIYCLDKPNVDALRAEVRKDHSRHLNSGALPIVLKGPLVADDGKTSVGSLIVVEAEDRAAVETFVHDDPFSRHGIWGDVAIRAFVNSATKA